jgi:hypothetical protein
MCVKSNTFFARAQPLDLQALFPHDSHFRPDFGIWR